MAQFQLRPQLSARNGVIAAVVLIVGTWLAVAATRTPGVAMGVIDDYTGH
jgi:predicted acyltransferase